MFSHVIGFLLLETNTWTQPYTLLFVPLGFRFTSIVCLMLGFLLSYIYHINTIIDTCVLLVSFQLRGLHFIKTIYI